MHSWLFFLIVDNPPTLSYSLGKLNHADGTTTVESPTTQESTDTVYTSSNAFPTITIDWRSSFQATALPLPVWMADVKIGVITAKVWIKINGM